MGLGRSHRPFPRLQGATCSQQHVASSFPQTLKSPAWFPYKHGTQAFVAIGALLQSPSRASLLLPANPHLCMLLHYVLANHLTRVYIFVYVACTGAARAVRVPT